MESQDMDSQSQYYTNLLTGNSHMTLDDSPPLPLTYPTNVKRSVRGTNFVSEEDKLLVSAWLNCSIDAIQGTDQKESQFWEKVLEYFDQYKKTTTERSLKSLTHRWSCIQKATNYFCSYLDQVEGLNQSGLTDHDKFDRAKIMYQSIRKKIYRFEHCWHLLKDQPKWISYTTKDDTIKKKTTVPSPTPTTTSSPTENVIELDRPMGRKAEKAKRKAQSIQSEEIIQLRKMKYTLLEESSAQEKEYYRLKAEKMEHDNANEQKKLHLEDERLKLKKEKLRIEAEKAELAKKDSDQRIMMMDVSVMSKI
ncbi:uncharacterized protein LOC143548710 [Bidens hawaiensis]|uniref:uncharacterized protein LOC143548710 n=1 Tax=Bidens hawaiensis TaxID=980011 RepID=UPI004049BFBB